MTPTDNGYSTRIRRFGRAARVVLAALLAAPLTAAAETPAVAFDADGVSEVRWGGRDRVGDRGLAVERLVFEQPAPESDDPFGRALADAEPGEPRVEMRPDEKRVVHHYPWGRAELTLEPAEDRLAMVLTLVNESDRAIADFGIRLGDLAFGVDQPALRRGVVQAALDRPLVYKAALRRGKCFVTCETFDPPVQFGFGPAHGRDNDRHDLIVLGGAPGLEAGRMTAPPLGRPRVEPGESLQLRFVVRFADADTPDASVLQPYFRAYREHLAPLADWPDRRPIGKVVVPSAPPYVTVYNPRGWFRSPQMDVRTPEGREQLRQKVIELAERSVERLRAADAQGVIVWNIEGGHVYADRPMGDPRRLDEIAPEMDAVADELFARFRDAGLRTGVCIRPSLLHHSERRQRWTHNGGLYDPDHETYPSPAGRNVEERIYPLVERMAAKIDYARKRWGCTLFYIHDNGYWWTPSADRPEEWVLMDAHVLRRLRERHPDVLLIPRYVERHWRSARSAVLMDARDPRMTYADSLRGVGDLRVGGIATPEWVIGNLFRYRHARAVRHDRAVPGPAHVLREAYWASAAPYVELKLRSEIREHVLTLQQHNEFNEEQAETMAAAEIAFETTPDRLREWMPGAFTVIDLDGAPIDVRRGELTRAAAWGDVLMWDATGDSSLVSRLSAGARATQQRLQDAAAALGVIEPDPDAPGVPLSLIWREGTPLDPASVVADRPVPDGLRVRLATAEDERSALLMLAWQGTPAGTVRLRPALGGMELSGRAVRVWRLPDGAAFGADEPVDVPPDPVAGLSALLVRADDSQAAPRPAGVLVAGDFDDGAGATMGGGLPARTDAPDATDAKTQDGALVLGGGAATFNVVPDWFEGSAEFDLKAPEAVDAPIEVLRLSHWLDVALSLETRSGKAGLTLQARENGLGDDDENGQQPRTVFAPLGRGTNGWRHAVLTWELGQYRLYVDGKQIAMLAGPARPRQRDGTVLQPGVTLGGGDMRPDGAMLDNFVLYDWTFPPELATAREVTTAPRPPAPPEAGPPGLWAWGAFPKEVAVGVNARGAPGWSRIRSFRIALYERLEGGRRRLAAAETGAYGGVGVTKLAWRPAKQIEPEGALKMEPSGMDIGDSPAFGDDEDMEGILGEVSEAMDLGKPYVIEIQPMPEGVAPKRSVNITAGRKDVEGSRW